MTVLFLPLGIKWHRWATALRRIASNNFGFHAFPKQIGGNLKQARNNEKRKRTDRFELLILYSLFHSSTFASLGAFFAFIVERQLLNWQFRWWHGGVAGFVLGLGIGLILLRNLIRRQESFAKAANQLGLVPLSIGDVNRLSGELSYVLGHPISLENFHFKRIGVTSIAFGDMDITYKSSDGAHENKYVTQQTCAIMEFKGCRLPEFQMHPRIPSLCLLDRAFGAKEVKFAEDRNFSIASIVKGRDENRIRDFLDGSVRKSLIAVPGLYVFATGGLLVFFRSKSLLKADALPRFVHGILSLSEPLASAAFAFPNTPSVSNPESSVDVDRC